jgi:hypothetical protein
MSQDTIIDSCGNVFADIGCENPDELHELAHLLGEYFKKKGAAYDKHEVALFLAVAELMRQLSMKDRRPGWRWPQFFAGILIGFGADGVYRLAARFFQ